MNELKQVTISVLRQLITGFLFTSGGIAALVLFQRLFHVAVFP